MAFPQASDYRPPIIPDGEVYDNPENGKSYYWTQILLPEGSTPDTATSIGGYWTVVCEDNQDHKYLLKYGDDVTDAPASADYHWNEGVRFYSKAEADKNSAAQVLLADNVDIYSPGYGRYDASTSLSLTADAGDATLKSTQNDVILEATAGKEAVVRTIDDTSDSRQITNKKYVDERDELLQQEIIELEEEIDAIAPSTQRGEWHFDKDKSFPDPGDYYLLKGASGANPEATEFYNEADGVVFHNVDANGVNNTWSNVAVDELIQIFDKPDPDFVLGTITNVDTNRITNAVWIEFDRISAEGGPNNNPDIKLSRINIFEPPTGGDVSGFVLKTGDTMTGNLTIDKSTGAPGASYLATLTLTGERSNTTYAASKIQFKNAQSTTVGELHYKSYDSNSWFTFTQDVDLNSKGIHSAARLRLISGGHIASGTSERIVVRTGGDSDGNAGTEIKRPGDNKRTFAIQGKPDGSGNVKDFFWAYGNSGTGGDAINYTGLVTQGNHIVNKKYVDGKVGGPYVNSSGGTITITKSGTNYYIS